MKKIICSIVILLTSLCTLFIGNCTGSLYPQNGYFNEADLFPPLSSGIFKSIFGKGIYFSRVNANENIRFFVLNPLDSITDKGQDSTEVKEIKNDTVITKGQDSSVIKGLRPVIIKADTLKDKIPDTTKTKVYKPVTKSDTVKITVKVPNAPNSITFQPIGLFLLMTNIEYDRAVTNSLSLGAKITFSPFLLRKTLEKGIKKEKDKKQLSTFSTFGMGFNFRYYPGNRAVEGFFLGGAIEGLSVKFDEIKENKTIDSLTFQTVTTSTINHRKLTLTRIEFEIGSRTKVSSCTEGFVIQWTLAAGVGYWNDGQKKGVIPLGSIGFGIGYAF